MPTPIKTNRITYKLIHEKINARYDIFSVETSMKHFKFGAYILDVPILEKNVKAVRYESGRRLYVLMNKNEDNKQYLHKVLSDAPEFDTVTLEQIQSDMLDDYILLQLLLNSLGSVNNDLLRFNNLTGHLYCFNTTWLRKHNGVTEQIPCLELHITADYLLEFDVKTFTSVKLKDKIKFDKLKFEDYPKYVLSVNNTLRRRLKNDKDPAFIQRQISDKKTGDIDFLKIGSVNAFESSKMGVVSTTIQRFNEQFSEFAEIGFREVTDYVSLRYAPNIETENKVFVETILKEEKVRIVDGIGDDYSQAFSNKLQEFLLSEYSVTAPIGKRIVKDCLNLYLIHDAAYYQDRDDPYKKRYPDSSIQHITFENLNENVSAAFSATIHELVIKSDLQIGQIRLFDWSKLGFPEDISFGMMTNYDDTERYFFMTVHPNGSFDIEEQEWNLFEQTSYSDCMNVFAQAKLNSETVEGIIRDSHGYINSIIDTGWITIPEIFKLHEELSNGNTYLRNKEKREELLNSVIDINKFGYENNIYYFVGVKGYGMKRNLHTAAHIRKIEIYEDAPDLFDKLLPLMNVTFVRNGQLTVIPFPFKYLKEYIRALTKTGE